MRSNFQRCLVERQCADTRSPDPSLVPALVIPSRDRKPSLGHRWIESSRECHIFHKHSRSFKVSVLAANIFDSQIVLLSAPLKSCDPQLSNFLACWPLRLILKPTLCMRIKTSTPYRCSLLFRGLGFSKFSKFEPFPPQITRALRAG